MGLDGLDRSGTAAWAIARLPLPAAASSQIWRWRGVSAAAPSIAAWRGRRPVATSSRRAPLGEQHGARGVGVGQRGAQRVARLDAPAERGQRAAELEPQRARPRAAPATPAATASAALAERHARLVVGLGDGAGVQRGGDRHGGAEALRQRELGVGQRRQPRRGARGGRARARRSSARASSDGFGRPCSRAQRAGLQRLGVARARSRPRPATAARGRGACRSPTTRAERAVEPALAQQLARLLERAALGQRADEHLDRAAGEHVEVVVDEVEREPRVVLGLGDAAGAQRELGRVPRRRHAQPQRAARQPPRRAARRSRCARLVGWSVSDQRAGAERVGASAGAASCSSRSPSSASRASAAQAAAAGAPRSVADPRAVGEHHAREQRVGGRRRGRSPPRAAHARRGASGSDQQRVERRRPRPPAARGVGLARQLLLEELRQPGVAGVDQVQRGQAREHVDPALAVVRPRAAPRAAAPASPAGRRRRRPCRAGRACARGRRPARAPPARARGRRRPRAARRAAAASAAARSSSSLTSGSACGPHSSRWQATTLGVGAGRPSARAPPRGAGARARSARGRRRSPRRSGRARSARRPAAEQPGGQQRVARRAELADRHAGDRGDDVRRRAVADHRQRRDDARGRAATARPAAGARRCARSR